MNNSVETGTALRSLAPMEWDGSLIDLRSYGSLTLTALVAPGTPRTFQWSPKGGADDADWLDWSLSSKSGGASSATIAGRDVFNGQAGGFVRLKPGVGAGGVFYLGAGS